ncbi:hypothetical protein K503DRAFT_99721 [Rhizopogon vinicolor AM-OR11-026]|uniref:Uncharacterized protein n=1 Tax=Rhizopogon vinicolor AM-OR11-026 TaxID=1314800 RepID=A0A1B7N330_9AGAM|nr:hypothetical protein K503DRAFT_99721 [Rhizopogon vinicolor AM-OR11-026]
MDSNLLRLPDGTELVTDADEEVSLIQRWGPINLGYSHLSYIENRDRSRAQRQVSGLRGRESRRHQHRAGRSSFVHGGQSPRRRHAPSTAG